MGLVSDTIKFQSLRQGRQQVSLLPKDLDETHILTVVIDNDGTMGDYDLMIAAMEKIVCKVVFIRIDRLTPEYFGSDPYRPADRLQVTVQYR